MAFPRPPGLEYPEPSRSGMRCVPAVDRVGSPGESSGGRRALFRAEEIGMVIITKTRLAALCALVIATGLGAMQAPRKPAPAPCNDYSNDPAGCQPSTFRSPLEQ